MDVMQLRRGLMMQGGGIIDVFRGINLVKGLSYVRGFIASNGTISAPTSGFQVTSELVENVFQEIDNYFIIERFSGAKPANQGGWFAMGFWDESNNFITRMVLSPLAYLEYDGYWYTTYFVGQASARSGGKVRYSFTTYGDVEIFAVKVSDFMEKVLLPYSITENAIYNNIPTA